MQGGGDDLSIDELVSNLSTYRQQLDQVRKLLVEDPGNSEYADMEKELQEVITLTEELLATAKQTELSALLGKANTAVPSYNGPYGEMHAFDMDQTGLSDFHNFSVGMKVQAVWSEDGEWYDATIEALTPNGYYVTYDGWGNKEEVDPDNVRPVEAGAVDSVHKAEREAEATRLAIKRKIAQGAQVDFESRTIPAKLRIDPNDPDDVSF